MVMTRKPVVKESGTLASQLVLGPEASKSKKRKKGVTKKVLDNDRANEALAYWVSASTTPVTVVEDTNFQNLLKILNEEASL